MKKLMIFCYILVIAFLPMLVSANEKSQIDLFNITRSKNLNEVHYAVNVDASCKLDGETPVVAYWLEVENGNIKTELTTFDTIAYGIIDQLKTDSFSASFGLKAIKEKKFTVVTTNENGRCSAESKTTINGNLESIQKVYVSSKEGVFMPTVIYIDLFSKKADTVERITPK